MKNSAGPLPLGRPATWRASLQKYELSTAASVAAVVKKEKPPTLRATARLPLSAELPPASGAGLAGGAGCSQGRGQRRRNAR